MPKLHYKITGWNHIEVPNHLTEKTIKYLEENPDVDSDTAYAWLEEQANSILQEQTDEYPEFVTPEDDNMQPTMQLCTSEHEILWSNV
jgi:hypothetical protein